MSTLPQPSVIRLCGTPFEIGRAHGQQLGTEIRAFLARDLADINAARSEPLSREQALAMALRYGAPVASHLPAIADEIRGLAEGADIDPAEAMLLQYRRELISDQHENGECSLFASHAPGQAGVLAQNIDLPQAMAPLCRLFHIDGSATGHPDILMTGFAGLCGYMGMNSAGLAIGINFVLSRGWQPGISPYLLVRHLLTLESVDAALQALAQLPRSSSRCLTLLDRQQLATVEMSTQQLSVVKTAAPGQAHHAYHTNHYLHADMSALDHMNIFSRNASRLRLNKMQELMQALPAPLDAEGIFSVFSDHSLYPVGICAHAEEHMLRDETVASVVMQPELGKLFLRRGHPCRAVTESFRMADFN